MTPRLLERPGHGAVRVSGADATSFLQSLVSQDLDAVAAGAGAHSLLLSPQGKLEVDFRALRVAEPEGDEWWLDCDAGFGSELAARLARYRIRVAVEIEDRSAAWDLLEVRGPDAPGRVAAAAGVDVPDAPFAHVAWGAGRVVRADWPTLAGVDVLGPTAEVRALRDTLLDGGIPPFAPGEYEVARIEAGVPRLGVDLDERTIPQEAMLEQDAVSFTKGCFLGQELVCRIDTRGHVNRLLRRVEVDAAEVPTAGDALWVDDRAVGELTSVAPVPGADRSVGLAMVRREIEPPASVVVRSSRGDLPARVLARP